MLLLKKILNKYSLFTVLKGAALMVNLILLKVMRIINNDQALSDNYKTIALGLAFGSLIDFGKSKKALIEGENGSFEIVQVILFLIGLIASIYNFFSLTVLLIAAMGAMTMYLKSVSIYKGNYVGWFKFETSISILTLIAIIFAHYCDIEFAYLWIFVLTVGFLLTLRLYINSKTRIVFFAGNFLLTIDTFIYQLISFLFFRIKITPLAMVYFSRLFNMSRATVSVYTTVNFKGLGNIEFDKILLLSLASVLMPVGVIYIALGEFIDGYPLLYLFVFVSSVAIFLSMKYLVSNNFIIRLLVSIALLLILLCIAYILY